MSTPSRTARRKPPAERRAEIIEMAAGIALAEGLDKVTARRVADALGVVPGLVNHYFRSADDLVAAAFGHAASREHHEVFAHAEAAATPLEQVQRLLDDWLSTEHGDAMGVLWLDALQASRRRPALRSVVIECMNADLSRLEALIRAGAEMGPLHVADPAAAARCIMALVDAMSIKSVIRDAIDYTPVIDMALSATEAALGVAPGSMKLTEPAP